MAKTAKRASIPFVWNAFLPSVFVLWAVTLLIFYSVTHFGFLNWDDDKNFTTNPWVQGFLGRYWSWAWQATLLGVYQPLSWLFLQAEVALSPQNPAPLIHCTSLLIHLLNATVVFALGIVLTPSTGKSLKLGALCGALYFALHPLQCETVVWASCQPYLLASFFGGLSVLSFWKSLDEKKSSLWYAISLLFFTASLLSKSLFVTLPAILWIVRLSRERGTSRRYLKLIVQDWGFWILAVCGVAVSLWARTDDPTNHPISLLDKVLLTPSYLGFFLQKTLLPIGFSPLYPLSLRTSIDLVLGLSLVAGTAVCLAKPKARRFGLILLALNILLLPGLAASMTEVLLFADRYAYLPNAAMGLLIAIGVHHLEEVKTSSLVPAQACAIFLGLALGLSSRYQLRFWSDSEHFWVHAMENGASRSPKAFTNLSALYLENHRWEEARKTSVEGLALDDSLFDLHNNLGMATWNLGQLKEAIAEFHKAIRISPDSSEAKNNLAYALNSAGEHQNALALLNDVLQSHPDFQAARQNRVGIHRDLGNIPEVLGDLKILADLSPNDPKAQNELAIALAQAEKNEEALAHFERAIHLNPGYVGARFNLATMLRKLGRHEEAHEALLQVLKIDPSFAPAIERLKHD